MTNPTPGTPAPGSLAWFEVATNDPDAAATFYGGLFNWTFETDPAATASGTDYRNITTSGASAPTGGIFGTGGHAPNHAVFYLFVTDVAATSAAAAELGGSVVHQNLEPEPGVPTFALLQDPAGNQFGIFTPSGS